MISVLSAVAEIERENIRTQTMAGREQKAREGKWNGGFAPYGYKLERRRLAFGTGVITAIEGNSIAVEFDNIGLKKMRYEFCVEKKWLEFI